MDVLGGLLVVLAGIAERAAVRPLGYVLIGRVEATNLLSSLKEVHLCCVPPQAALVCFFKGALLISGVVMSDKEDDVPVFGPSSITHQKFLNCTSNLIIFGGGRIYCASTLKTVL